MAVFTFVCRNKGGLWTAKQHAGDGNLEGSAATPYELQQQLRNAALQTAGAGAVSVDFSLISPSSAVLQVLLIYFDQDGLQTSFGQLGDSSAMPGHDLRSSVLKAPSISSNSASHTLNENSQS